jgi:glycosidase
MQNPGLVDDFHRTLADFSPQDNIGSAYCIRRYEVDSALGGPQGLASAREALRKRGVGVILDFVPNHVAPDHPWTIQHPEYFIRGSHDDLAEKPDDFFEVSGHVIARGRDPFFPPWPDVAQLNAFNPGFRKAVIDTLRAIGDQCDGVRVDMAMLMLTNIFSHTWMEKAGAHPGTEFWEDVLPAVRQSHPDMLFMAEVYWDMEWTLQQMGFDFCYDKRLYDRLERDTPESVRLHLTAGLDYQDKLVRFIENHDEKRAAAVFEPLRLTAVAFAALTLPGAKLFHEGQLDGRKVKIPVFLRRRPEEKADLELGSFYKKLLDKLRIYNDNGAKWQLFERFGNENTPNWESVLAWGWHSGSERALVIVNLSDESATARIRIPWDELAGKDLRLRDDFNDSGYELSNPEIVNEGLVVSLPGWGWHFLELLR